MDRVFKMVGECTIPEERREELNKHVINLLDRCGMRLMGKMDFKGTSVNVLKHLAPDCEGIVRFDYSIFQREKVKDGSYDMKTCVINAPSRMNMRRYLSLLANKKLRKKYLGF